MTDESPKQRDSLNQARHAVRDGNFPEALEHYEYFFDHALDDDPYALYGVRLSYCLNEWAQLGQQYPAALTRLEEKRDEALRLLDQSREPERFHDYMSICGYLGRGDEPIHKFIDYHAADRELSQSILRFIWRDLVKAKHWDICGFYLVDSVEKYDGAVERLDETMRVSKADPAFGGATFEKTVQRWYVRDVSNLILVLNNTDRSDEATLILNRAILDMRARGYEELVARIEECVRPG